MPTIPPQRVRGNVIRALRTFAIVAIAVELIFGSALWHFAKDPTDTKIAAEFLMLFFAVAVAVFATLAAATSVASIRDGRLNFYFLGIRTKSIPLDNTTFDAKKHIVRIHHGTKTYIPNGFFDRDALIHFLRNNAVPQTTPQTHLPLNPVARYQTSRQ